jgi:hypothetical protein
MTKRAVTVWDSIFIRLISLSTEKSGRDFGFDKQLMKALQQEWNEKAQ